MFCPKFGEKVGLVVGARVEVFYSAEDWRVRVVVSKRGSSVRPGKTYHPSIEIPWCSAIPKAYEYKINGLKLIAGGWEFEIQPVGLIKNA